MSSRNIWASFGTVEEHSKLNIGEGVETRKMLIPNTGWIVEACKVSSEYLILNEDVCDCRGFAGWSVRIKFLKLDIEFPKNETEKWKKELREYTSELKE